MTDHVTEEQAWVFFNDRLNIDYPQKLMERNRLEFLNTVIQSFQNKVPFHNLAVLNSSEGERSCPSVEQNIKWVLAGFGGICWTLNSGMSFILRAIGFDVTTIVTAIHPHRRNNHLALVLKNVQTQGDTYFVDFGMGEPSFRAVCLDFEKETEVWHESFRSHKFTRVADVYYHLVRSRVPRKKTPEGNPWKVQLDFRVEPIDLETVRNRLNALFYTVPTHNFSVGLRAVIFRDNKLVAMKGSTLLLENEDHILDAREMTSDGEYVSTVCRYFPMLPGEMVKRAINQCNATVQKHGPNKLDYKVKVHLMQK